MNEDWIQKKISESAKLGLKRTAVPQPYTGGIIDNGGKRIINFSGNDYLNLSKHPYIIERSREALEKYGCGSTASRLVSGTLPIHEELEHHIAISKSQKTTLVYGSGYLTSLGTIPSLVDHRDIIFADRLIHACMIDGCRLSGAKLVRFHHNNMDDLKSRIEKYPSNGNRRLILTESLFSMDGDISPLTEIAEIAKENDAMLMVDEAHAMGIYGSNGSGRVAENNLQSQTTVTMGTLSKALAGYGGYVCCSNRMRDYLINTSRSFIYTTAPPPAQIGAALGALEILKKEPTLGDQLLKKADQFRKHLHINEINTLNSASHIIPILIGDNYETVNIANKLKEQDILVGAIRPPTVPKGTSRLRISLSLAHSDDDISQAAETIIRTIHS